jgi:hypothetical protein
MLRNFIVTNKSTNFSKIGLAINSDEKSLFQFVQSLDNFIDSQTGIITLASLNDYILRSY